MKLKLFYIETDNMEFTPIVMATSEEEALAIAINGYPEKNCLMAHEANWIKSIIGLSV